MDNGHLGVAISECIELDLKLHTSNFEFEVIFAIFVE